MNIREELLADKILSKTKAITIADSAAGNPKRFTELMACFTSNEYRLAQRAAWSVSYAVRKNPTFIQLHINTLITQLKRTGVHNAVIRNTVRILQEIDVPEQYHGEVMNACFGFAEKYETPIAIKAFALTTLYNLSKIYPEIQGELQTLIEEKIDNETAAFKSRGNKILKALNKSKAPGKHG